MNHHLFSCFVLASVDTVMCVHPLLSIDVSIDVDVITYGGPFGSKIREYKLMSTHG